MSQVHSIEREETEVVVEQPKTVVTVGSYSRALIKHAHQNGLNWTNEVIAEKVVAKFAEHEVAVKTSAACIAWYKSDMRKKGVLPKGAGGGKSIMLDLESIEL